MVWLDFCSKSLLEVDVGAESRYLSHCVANIVMEKNMIVLTLREVKRCQP